MAVYNYDSNTGNLTTVATSGQRTWVGTEAQYKAAQQAGTLPNNAIICITDDEVDTSHYSTNETFTGMYWIDGKKIYRKVFDLGTLTTNVDQTIAHNISNLNAIIDIRGIAFRASSNSSIDIPYAYNPNSGNPVQTISVEVHDTNIRVFCRNIGTNFTGFAILEYTKTTD